MDAFTVASHFEGKEAVVREIYDRLLAELRKFGAVTESPKKTSIHLDNVNALAGVYTRRRYILLHFRMSSRIEHPRISKHEKLSARRFMHTDIPRRCLRHVNRKICCRGVRL